MTKINKVGKSTFVIAILSFLLVAVLAFGGTYAYFSAATKPAGGTVTMGALYVYLKDDKSAILDGDTALGEITIAQPNQEILNKTYTVDLKESATVNKSTISALVRVKITAELDASKMNKEKTAFVGNTFGDSHITPATIFQITSNSNKWYYNEADGYTYYVEDKSATDPVAAELTDSVALPVSIIVNGEVGDDGSKFFMGATGTFAIVVEAIQADYLDDNTSTNKTYTVSTLKDKWKTVVDAYTAPPAEPTT